MKKFFAVFLMVFSLPAFAQEIEVKLSGALHHGGVAIVDMSYDGEADSFAVNWQGKIITIPAECAETCTAKVLLPLPYDEPGEYYLTAIAMADGTAFLDKSVRVLSAEKTYPSTSLTVEPKYVSPGEEALKRIAAEREVTKNALIYFSDTRMWELPLKWPTDKGTTSPFGQKRMFNGEPKSRHSGVDFKAATGDIVKAVAPGTVILVGDYYYAGNNVFVDHGQGVVSMYMHFSETKVELGQQVNTGDVLGKAGATGRVTGPHLHFGLAVQGVLVDPMILFE